MTSSVKKGKKIYNEKGFSGLFQATIFKFLANSFGIPSRKDGAKFFRQTQKN